MAGEASPTNEPVVRGGNSAWRICVAFSVAPLALFLISIEVLTAGGVDLGGLLADGAWGKYKVFSPAVKAHASVSFFGYAIYVFAHSLICLGAISYFLSRFALVKRFATNVLSCVFFGMAVALVVVLVSANDTAFQGYMIQPLSVVLTATNSSVPLASWNDSQTSFLLIALVFPTSLGIFAVVMASGSFHGALFLEPRQSKENRTRRLEVLAEAMRHDLIALSFVLVSSVMTARAFFSIPAKFFDPDNKGLAAFYTELSQTLSTGAGILFSATLIAAFLPGFLTILSNSDDQGSGKTTLSDFWSRLATNTSWVSERFKGIWQSLAALIAPAISAPMLDLLSGFFG
ncbi:MAG: hypothetical protein ABJM26_07720 [Anderseniella sp.]|uniref:hypothetical protein n=1 Tax=Parasphingorhabdus sp. TaxID=2709688 RepID=UPI003290493F